MKTKKTKTSTTVCPFCSKKNYYFGNTLRKCKHLNHAGIFNGGYKWVFDKLARGFKATFTIKHTTPEENKNVQPTGRMSKMFNRI